jgi:TPR repeat protein
MKYLALFLLSIAATISMRAQDPGLEAFVNHDYENAMRLLIPQAEKGDARSQFAVGMMLEGGLAGRQDAAGAARWYRRASDQNFPPAPLYLAVLYQQGSGVARSYDTAIELYQKAFLLAPDNQMIRVHAAYQLGEIYNDSARGVRDAAEAAHWYALAGENGNDDGYFKAGWIYWQGDGVARNDSLAIVSFRGAAAMKNTRAMGLLATLLAQGSANDAVEAYAWSTLAAELDPIQAGTTLRFVLKENLSAEQLAQAEMMMGIWRERWK